MRRALLAGSFVVLITALWVLWAHRFEREPGLPVWTLADLREELPAAAGVEWLGTPDQPALRLRVDARNPRVAVRLAFPGLREVECLHLRFRMSARGLIPGKENWETGRFMIEWHPPDGSHAAELDTVGGIKLDVQNDPVALVAVPRQGPAIPTLRLEHLGRAGEWVLSDLEITAVRERVLWKSGRWVLASAWLMWTMAMLRSWPGVSRWRAFCAALICLLMTVHFVIPGPWKVQHAIGGDFQLGASTKIPVLSKAPPSVTSESAAAIFSGAVAATGKIPVQGGFVIRTRYAIKQARPLLHLFLLFGPTLVLAGLVGRKHALALAITLALLIESAQFAFGYGFGWDDVLDLFIDGLGIALGIWVHRRVMTKARRNVSAVSMEGH